MRTVGILTTAVVSLAAAGVVAVGVFSLPDIKRYLRIRQM